MLENIVKHVKQEYIVAPLFSGPNFNNINNNNGYGSGVGGGMGDGIGSNNNVNDNGFSQQQTSTDRMYEAIKPRSERQNDVKYSHGYDLPGSDGQLHVHEDENGYFSHLKSNDRKATGPTLNSYETAMLEWMALQINLRKF